MKEKEGLSNAQKISLLVPAAVIGGDPWTPWIRLMLGGSLVPDAVSHSAAISACEKGKH